MAMKFAPSFLEEIKNRVSVSSVVGRAVAWDREKSNPSKGDHWACCPFHVEKSPSFHADDRKGQYFSRATTSVDKEPRDDDEG